MIAPIDNATKESLLSTRDMGKTATICVGVNGIIYDKISTEYDVAHINSQ